MSTDWRSADELAFPSGSTKSASQSSQVTLSLERQDCSPLKLFQTDCGGLFIICHWDSGLINSRSTLLQGRGYFVKHALVQFTNLLTCMSCAAHVSYLFCYNWLPRAIPSASVEMKTQSRCVSCPLFWTYVKLCVELRSCISSLRTVPYLTQKQAGASGSCHFSAWYTGS